MGSVLTLFALQIIGVYLSGFVGHQHGRAVCPKTLWIGSVVPDVFQGFGGEILGGMAVSGGLGGSGW